MLALLPGSCRRHWSKEATRPIRVELARVAPYTARPFHPRATLGSDAANAASGEVEAQGRFKTTRAATTPPAPWFLRRHPPPNLKTEGARQSQRARDDEEKLKWQWG